MLDVLLLFQHGGARAGHNGQRHNKGRQQTEGDGPGHVAEKLAHHAGGEHQRQKNADRRQGGGYDGPGHLTRALHRRAGGGHAAAPQTVDVFNDDNRVVDQHADAQRQTGQRQDIEGNAGEIHQHNGKQHAQRHTDGHDDGRAQVLQKQRQYDDGQHCALDQVGQHAVDDELDIVALVHDGRQVQALVFGHHRFHRRAAGVGDRRGGRRRALVQRQQHGAVLVHLGVGVVGVVGHFDLGYIGQAHVADAVDIAEHHAFQLVRVGKGITDLDDVAVVVAVAALDIARGHREVLRINELLQRRHVQQLVQIRAFQRLLTGGLVFLLRGFELGLAGLELGLAAGDLELAQLQLGLGAAQQQLDGHIGHGGVYRLVAKACQHFLQLVALFIQLGQHFLCFSQLVAQGGGGVVQRLLQRLHTVVQRSLGLLPRSQQRRGVLQGDLRRGER